MKKTAGIIAAGHPQTANARKIALELGGNAFDAAIAAAFASCVVESSLTSLGGSGFCLTHTQGGENCLWDFFSPTPQQKKPVDQVDFYPVTVNFGGARQEFHVGLGSIAVPGNIAGFVEVHRALGRLPLDLVIEPALNYAREGFILNQFNDFSLHLLEPILLAYPAGKEIYAPQGQLLQMGQLCVMKDLANSLEILAKEGYKSFYQGDIADHIIKNIAQGSYLDFSDFSSYQILQRKPLRMCYKGYEILTNPPPSSGGILISFALKLLEKYSLSAEEFLGETHLKILIKVMELTNQARQKDYDNYVHVEGISETFLGGENILNYINKLGSTTHISVLDGEGNGASLTSTNGEGSSYFIPELGIMLNNMLGEADLNPYGFHNWLCNQRLSSMMAPTIILQGGQPRFVLGSGGSNRIRTALLQVISHLLDWQLPLETAINTARLHWERQVLDIEPFLGRDEVLKRLNLPLGTEINAWNVENMFFGGVHAVSLEVTGEMRGMGDRRRQGAWEKFAP